MSTFNKLGFDFISSRYTISFRELEYISEIDSEIYKENFYLSTGISNRQILYVNTKKLSTL